VGLELFDTTAVVYALPPKPKGQGEEIEENIIVEDPHGKRKGQGLRFKKYLPKK